MNDLEKVIRGIKWEMLACRGKCGHFCTEQEIASCKYDKDGLCIVHWGNVAMHLLKSQEQEISRLKHHVDCDAAEKLPSGCVGYGRGFNDDEPCETCKQCPAYNGYGEE